LKLFFCILLTFITFLSFSQNNEKDIIGDWAGYLNIGDKSIKIVFHFSKVGKQFEGTMDSPDQGAFGLKLDNVSLILSYLNCEISSFKISYKARLIAKDSLVGEFTQGNFSSKLNLKKSTKPILAKYNRPQEPKAPFFYKREDVTFKNTIENIELSGTLTVPKGKGPFSAMILVSGSGPQNRDEEIMGHKPFWVIADYLTKNGIAVLRYDDRGVGKSEGDFQKATTANFALDAQAAYIFLKNHKRIDKKRIGIIGHSEGGMIAQMVAASDTQVRMIVLLAAPGIKISDLMLKQTEVNLRLEGISEDEIAVSLELNKRFYDLLNKEDNEQVIIEKVQSIINEHCESMTSEEANEIKKQTPMMLKTLLSPWFRYFIKFDPDLYLRDVKCPVLAINGRKDVQVECDDNLYGIAMSLEKAGNRKYEFHKMDNLNHLMQNATTGAVSEYIQIEETFSKDVLKIMKNWIKAR
jgi:uncharacterized protein